MSMEIVLEVSAILDEESPCNRKPEILKSPLKVLTLSQEKLRQK